MNKTTVSGFGFTLAGVLALTLPARVQAQAPQYTVTILSGLGGSDGSRAVGISASGQVAGGSYTSGNAADDAVTWNGTTPTVLTGLGGTVSAAYGINATGQVAG